MQYEDRVVCFLDILGFEDHISESINKEDGSDCEDKIRKLAEAFCSVRDILGIKLPETESHSAATQFSDSIVISFPAEAGGGVFDALRKIMQIQISLVRKGYLCRGGVARGKLIHTQTLLFGPALVKAYKMESKAAIYPRVILDTSIINTAPAAPTSSHTPTEELNGVSQLIQPDLDGMHYVDYITKAQLWLDDLASDYPAYRNEIDKIITSAIPLVDKKGPSVEIKYRWLLEKFHAPWKE